MSIALVTYIPDNCIVRTVENTVKCERKFYNAKIACKVPAVFSNNFYNCTADFLCKLTQLLTIEILYIFWTMNL